MDQPTFAFGTTRLRGTTMETDQSHRLTHLSSLIGNTPLLAIDLSFRGRQGTIYAKAEHLNLTGSIKDRMAFTILQEGYGSGRLVPGAPIVEVSSGNTGIAFAALGRGLGHPVTIFMPDWVSRERYQILTAYGAEIVSFGPAEGGFAAIFARAAAHAAKLTNGFLPRQFENPDNVTAHYRTTGPEIWYQLRFHGLMPVAFVAGVGTGGTLMGVGRFLRSCDPAIRLYPLEPANSPLTASGPTAGQHRIEGIADGFLPPIVELDDLDPVVAVEEGDAILMAQQLANKLGLGVGISAGANFLGALTILEELGDLPDTAAVVTVFPDDHKKYLSTDLLRTEPVKPGYLTPGVTLLGMRAMKRVCYTCCVPEECLASAPLDFSSAQPPPPCPRRRGPASG